MSSVWSAIEELPDLAAVCEDWRRWCGDEFETFRKALLDKTQRTARAYPCAGHCQTPHRLKQRDNGMFIALCDCPEEMDCGDFIVSEDEARVWKLSVEKLGRTVARALGVAPEFEPAGICGLWRLGVIRGTVVPVFLSIQNDGDDSRAAFAQLAARARRRFLVVTPTFTPVNARSLEAMDSQQAELLCLERHFSLNESGALTANEAALALVDELVGGSGATELTRNRAPRYFLRKGAGVWKLVFDGKDGEVRDSRGMDLVAWLLLNPPLGGVHGTDLASLVCGHAVVEAMNEPAHKDATRAEIEKRARSCMAVIRKEDSSEMERQEARDELETLSAALNVVGRSADQSAENQVRAVRRAIERCIDGLRTAVNRKKEPHPVLRAFGEHLNEHLWIPSSRFSGKRTSRTKTGTAGKFTYEPPAGVVWKE